MENFKVKLNVEPTNDYEKAKLELLKAMDSIRALPSYQQKQLDEELFGVQAVVTLARIMQQYFG